jgi:hypothetical protein
MTGLFPIVLSALRRLATAALLGAIIVTASGCQLFGAIVETTSGDEPIKAAYKPAQVPMVVIVENFNGSSSVDSRNLARFIESEITDNKVAPLISSDKVEVLRDNNPTGFRNMTIEQIGKAVGAGQILYVDNVKGDFDQPQASDMVQGSLSVNVRIISVDTAASVWPAGSVAGLPFDVEVPFTPLSQTSASDLRSRLTRQMALQIVNTFHDHDASVGDDGNSDEP